ncbi:salivary glue protein Sgs-3-like [Ruditapes philippinarum]|uniref:salivary glue protein Sgs-3-like n=1 Tax=Ruditapes philippinarum TaxID=129788 RepID=UPI00295AEED6|nr:salivary glue protein Sgs-3-like [Ruditapes philippinarum]
MKQAIYLLFIFGYLLAVPTNAGNTTVITTSLKPAKTSIDTLPTPHQPSISTSAPSSQETTESSNTGETSRPSIPTTSSQQNSSFSSQAPEPESSSIVTTNVTIISESTPNSLETSVSSYTSSSSKLSSTKPSSTKPSSTKPSSTKLSSTKPSSKMSTVTSKTTTASHMNENKHAFDAGSFIGGVGIGMVVLFIGFCGYRYVRNTRNHNRRLGRYGQLH